MASALPLAHYYRAAFGRGHTLANSVDWRARGVVSSNFGKRAVDPAQSWELDSTDRLKTLGQADSWIEIHGRSVFRYETTGISAIAE